MNKKSLCYLISIAVFASGLVLGGLFTLQKVKNAITNQPEPYFHEHADFALFLNGEKFDFTKGEYMSTKPCIAKASSWVPVAYAHGSDLDDAVHLHDGIGGVVHMHRENVSWHDFFESLKMDFEDTIFIDDEGNQYREDDNNEFRFIKNGEEVETLQDVEIRDLDRVLISYGPKDRAYSELLVEYGQITNDACYYSDACLHRGSAPLESCGSSSDTQSSSILDWIGL